MELDSVQEVASTSRKLAFLHEELLEYDSAIWAWEDVLIYDTKISFQGKIDVYIDLVNNHLEIHDFDSADSLLVLADSIAVIISDTLRQAHILTHQGYAAQLQDYC